MLGKENKGVLRSMSLQLEDVTLKVRGETYIDEANLQLDSGSFNVLLGHTLARLP